MSDFPHGVVFRVLGSLEVVAGGRPLELGGPQLRMLLALLLAARGRAVGVGTLVDELWGAHAPHDADRTVRTYVSRLRRYLGQAGAADVIVTRAPGYAIEVDPEFTDFGRFEAAAAAGRSALGTNEPAVAAGQLTAALALWRGTAFAEFPDTPALDAEANRLTRLRDDAVEDRIDALLELGHGRELIAELEARTTSHPGHERPWGQLMKALYRAGRQTDALDTFRRARRLLLDEAGVEPSPVLTVIQRQIFTHDTALLAPVTEANESLRAGDRALLEDGDLNASRREFEAAYVAADRTNDAEALARATLGLSGLWVHEHRTATGAHQLRGRLERALAVVDPESPLALRLRVRVAGEADYRAGAHTGILALLEETRQAEATIAHAEALSIAHHCVLGPEHGALRQSLALELIGQSARTGRRADRLMGLLWHTVDLFLAADSHAERRLGELEEALAEQDNLAVGFAARAMRVMLTIRAGRFAEAEKQAQSCAEAGQRAGDADAIGWYGAHLVAIRWFQGRLDELLPMLDELVHSSTLSEIDNSYFAAHAAASALTGDHRKAASSLARLTGRGLSGLPRSSTWLLSMNGIAETAYRLGDVDVARQCYELLSPFADLPVMASLAVACFGSAHYALGVAALAAGAPDRGVTHLRTAVRRNLALGHWPAVAISRARHAEALSRRDGPGDAALAEAEMAVAHREARSMGVALALG